MEKFYFLDPSSKFVFCNIRGYYAWFGSLCLSMMKFEDENWYLVRRNAQTDKWHPASDNALGTEEAYGTSWDDPIGTETFNLKYSEFAWDKIMFAWGNLESWIVLDRTHF